MSGIDKPLYTLDKIEENTNKIPKIIFNQYDLLYDMYKAGEYYGALLQVKDVLELAIKFPVLIMLDIAVCYVNDADDVNGSSSGKKDKYKTLEDFLRDVLSCEISFGSLERFAKGLAQFEDSIAPSKYRDEFLKVQDLLNKIYRLYYNPVGLEGNENISSWRNRVIGHGAVDADLGRVKEDVEVMLRNLNAILSVSDYRDIAITQIGSSYSVSASENKDKLVLAPYVLVNSEFDTGKAEYSYLFESFNRRGQGKLLDYINNHKKVDAGLSRIYSSISEKLNTKFASDNKLDDCFIKPEDEQEIMDMESRLLVRVPAFFEETKALLARDKGVLLLRAERGTGKTVFSRLIINNFRQNGGNRYKLELKSKNSGSIYKDLGVEKDSLYVCTYNFNNSWMYDRYSFMTSLEEALEPGNDRRNRAYGKAQGRFKNTFLNEYPDADCDEDEYEEYRTKVSFEFNSWLSAALERYKADNENAKLLIVFDGLDEIPSKEDAVNVAELIDEETLPDNVYILCLMRPDSEWRMPKKLKVLNLPAIEISKDRFVATLCEYIQSNLCSISQNEINAIMEKGDRRFIHVQFVCDIYKLVSQKIDAVPRQLDEKVSRVLVKKEISLLEEYMEIFKQKSKKYYNGLMRLLAVLYLARKPLALDEMYFLYNSVGDERPDFRFYALLRDLRGCISVSRVDGKNLYSIANEEWREQLSDNYFSNTRNEVLKDMSEYIKSVLPDNECMSDNDIKVIETLFENDNIDAVLAEKVLKCIDYAHKHDMVNFEKNLNKYSEFSHIIYQCLDVFSNGKHRSYINVDENPELFVFSRYMERVIDVYTGVQADKIISGIEKFTIFLGYINTAFVRQSNCSSETLERLFYVFYVEIMSLYHNGICAKDVLYAYMEKIVDVWFSLYRQKLVNKGFCMLLELLACMHAIPKKGKDVLVNKLLNEENITLELLKLNIRSKFEQDSFEILKYQIAFIDKFSKMDKNILEKQVDEIRERILLLLERVTNDACYGDQEKEEFIGYVYNFFKPIYYKESPVDMFRVCNSWYRFLLYHKYTTKLSYINALNVANYYYNKIREHRSNNNFNCMLQLLAEIKEQNYTCMYDYNLDLAFYEIMTMIEMSKFNNSNKIDKDILCRHIDEFTILCSDSLGNHRSSDVYVRIAFYVNMACLSFDYGYVEEAIECLNMLSEVTDSFNGKSDNNFSLVKSELFTKCFFDLVTRITGNNDLLIKCLGCLIKLYKYQNGYYAEVVEKCCIKCLEYIFSQYDLVNECTERMLFNRYSGRSKEEIEPQVGEYMDTISKVVPDIGPLFKNDSVHYLTPKAYIEAHQSIYLDSENCYLEAARYQILYNLFNIVLCLKDEVQKQTYSKWKLRCIRDKQVFSRNSDYVEALKATLICKNYDILLTVCSNKITKVSATINNIKNLQWKVENYLSLAEAYWFRSLCYQDMGEKDLFKADVLEVERIASKLKISIADMIKAEFKGRNINEEYPLFNYIYHDLINPYEEIKDFDLTGYDL